MELGVRGKLALVTAATRGLGRACAETLAQEGCRLAICSRDGEAVARAAEAISGRYGVEVHGWAADVSREEDIEALMESVRGAFGEAPAICVVNAGGPPPGDYQRTPQEAYQPALELTLMSGIRLTHRVLPPMRAAGWGRIVFISSISVKQPLPQLLLSNTARAGLTGFMKTVAREVAADGVTLNAVLPGVHDTDRVRQTAQHTAETQGIAVEAALKQMTATIPARRIGRPQELAAMVAFLASEHAGFITGSSILLDGGAYAGLT